MLGHTILAIFIVLTILIVFSNPPELSQPTTIALSVQEEPYVQVVSTYLNDPLRISHEVNLVKENVPRPHTGVDVGSSTGERVHIMNERGLSTTGLENSKFMVRHAKQTFQSVYVYGEYTSPILFQQSLSHVTCLNYTYCFIRDKGEFLRAVHHWLEPEGFLFIHTPLEWKYGPLAHTPKYTTSLVHHTLRETIQLEKTYKVNRPVYWEPKEKVIRFAESCGFKLERTLTLPFPYENDQVTIFKSVDLVYL
jgi:SAM-dependent methyltransferase